MVKGFEFALFPIKFVPNKTIYYYLCNVFLKQKTEKLRKVYNTQRNYSPLEKKQLLINKITDNKKIW